jgi:predicted transcriptional regulator YdeE
MATIDLICKKCQNTFSVPYKSRNRKFCSRDCVNSYQVGENNPSFGKTYRTKETHPEWALSVKQTHKDRGHISGEKNPMKNKETALKVSKSRSEKFQTDANFRQSVSDSVRKAWKDGKFDDVKVGHCKWFKFVKLDGTICNVQGTWEYAYAAWLEKNNINFISHKGRISYIDENNNERSYYPDFFLPETNEYIDIKNKYHFSLNEKKWDLIRKSNPEVKITLLFEEDLKQKEIL